MTHPLERPRSNVGRCLVWAVICALGAILVVCGGGWAVLRARVGVRPNAGWIDAERKQVVPPELSIPADNGFDTYERALAARSEPDDPEDVCQGWLKAASEHDRATLASGESAVRDVVRRNEPALRLLHEAADKEYLSPIRPGPEALYPSLAKDRSLARLAIGAAVLAHQDGDDKRALGLVEDGYALGVNVPHGGCLIESLVGIAAVAIAARTSTDIMLDGTASPGVLKQHAVRVRELRGRVYPFSGTLGVEWLGTRAVLDMVRRGGPQTLSALTSASGDEDAEDVEQVGRNIAWSVAGMSIDATEEWMEDRYARMIEAAEKPFGDTSLDDLNARTTHDIAARRDVLAGIVMPVSAKAHGKYLQSWAVLMADETIACLQAYRKEKGHYPESLDALVPGYMPELPIDPWTGKPMLYKVTDDGYLLYACGPDREDDGGVCTENDRMTPDQVFVPVPHPKPPGAP